MSTLGQITLNEIIVLEVSDDPSINGLDAPSGSLAILTDGTGIFVKGEGGDFDWVRFSAEAPSYTSVLFDDFVSGTVTSGQIGQLSWRSIVSGTDAVVSSSNSLGTDDFGIIQLSTGTTDTGRTSIILNSGSIIAGGGYIIFEARVRIPVLSDGTENYDFYIGLGDVTGAGDMVDGIYFQHSATSNNWILKTSSNSIRTQVISSVAIAVNTWYKLKFIVNVSGTSVSYYINNNLVNTITTNIPNTITRVTGPLIKIQKTLGTTSRSVLIDYYSLRKDFSPNR